MTKLFQISFLIVLLIVEYFSLTNNFIFFIENSWEKINYFIVFFILYILFDAGFKIFTTLGKVSLLFIFALQLELIHFFTLNNYFSFLDIIADSLGVLVAIGVIYIYKTYIKVKDTDYIRL